MRVLAAVLLASVALPLGVAWADDVRPASLDIREVSPGVFDVRWKTPMRGRSRLRAYPQLPREALVVEGSRTGEAVGDSWIERFRFELDGGLLDREVGVAGLAPTSRNALLRVRLLDGTRYHAVLGSSRPTSVVEAPAYVPPTPWPTLARRSLLAGLDHAARHLAHVLLALALVLAGGRRAWGVSLTLVFAFDLTGSLLPLPSPFDPGLGEAFLALLAAVAAREVLLERARTLPFLAAVAGLLHGLASAGREASLVETTAFVAGVDAVHLLVGACALLLASSASRRALAWGLGPIALATAVLAAAEPAPTTPAPPPPPLALDVGEGAPTPTAPAAAGLETDVEVYLDVGVFETRVEILGRLPALAAWLGVDVQASGALTVGEQEGLLDALAQEVAARLRVALDGADGVADARRRAFATQDATGTYLREEPREEDASTALVGFAHAYRTPRIPRRVEVAIADGPAFLETLRARVLDPEVSREVRLEGSDVRLTWSNELTEEPLPGVEALRVESPPRPFSIGLTVVLAAGLALGLGLLRRGRGALAAVALRAALALSLLAAPLLVVDVGSAVGTPAAPAPEEARRIVRVLLDNVYRAFNVREEEAVYDRLAATLTDATRADAYLENRRALAVARVGGARTHVDAVELLDVGRVEPLPDGGFATDAEWTVAGSVTHFGHRHLRQNVYRARLAVVPVEGTWKIDAFAIRELERTR